MQCPQVSGAQLSMAALRQADDQLAQGSLPILPRICGHVIEAVCHPIFPGSMHQCVDSVADVTLMQQGIDHGGVILAAGRMRGRQVGRQMTHEQFSLILVLVFLA